MGKSKSPTGTGRAIPLNSRILSVLEMWAAQFPGRHPTHFVFAREKYGAAGEEDSFGFTAGPVVYDTDPTRPIGDWKEAWEKAKKSAGVILSGKAEEEESEPLKCRFHDLRHTAVTRLLEGGIPYPVVASMMGWSASTAIRMAKRYGHIGSQALRDAADVSRRGENSRGVPQKVPKVDGGAKCRGAVSGRKEMAPQVGLEPTTLRLTAGRTVCRLLILKGVTTARRVSNPLCLVGLADHLADGFPELTRFSSLPFSFILSRRRFDGAQCPFGFYP